MKTLIKNVLYNLDHDNVEDPQFRWEYLEYEIGNFSIHFSKGFARNMKTERTYLENKYTKINEKRNKVYQENTETVFFLVTSY